MSNHSVGRKLLRSSGAATLSQVWRIGVTLGTQAILRRLVTEADWGVWHWSVDLLFVLLAQVRDLGLPAHIVRDKARPYRTFLTVEVIWGGAFAVALAFAAPWLARAGPDNPRLLPVIWGLLLFFVVEGVGKVPLTYFEAEIRLDKVLVPEIARNLCFAVVAVALAWGAGLGIYAMVIAHVAAATVFTAMLWGQAWGQMPLDRAADPWRLVRASLPLMPMALVILAIDVADVAMLGRWVPSAELGVYGAALTLALMTTRVLEYPLRRALYPAFVAVRDDSGRSFEVYRLATIFLMSVHVLAAGFLFTNARLVLTIYGSGRYVAAAPYLQLLCLVPLVQPFARCAEDVLLPRHEERFLTAAFVLNLVTLFVAGAFMVSSHGTVGMAWAKLLPIGSLLLAWAVHRIEPRRFWRLVADLLVLYLTGTLLFSAAVRLSDLVLSDAVPVDTVSGEIVRLVLTGLAALLAAGVFALLHGRPLRNLFRHELGFTIDHEESD